LGGEFNMSWNTFLSSAGIRSDRFNNYDTALKHFNTVKPIRGREVELRPLGNNRTYTQCSITHDPLTDTVSARLYNTECVSIDSSGVITLATDAWITPTTANFIEACLPSKWGSVYLHRKRLIYKTRGGLEYEIPKDGLFLQASPNWEEADLVPTQEIVNRKQYEYKADRKVLNKIRKHYAGFLSMVDVMSAMSSSYEIAEYCEYFPIIPQLYIDAENEHNREQAQNVANGKNNGYMFNFNSSWAMRRILDEVAGLPPIARLSEFNQVIQANERSQSNKWLKTKASHVINEDLPKYKHVLREALSDKVQNLRRLMLGIVANGNNYAKHDGGYGRDGNMVTVPTLFGDVALPRMWFDTSKTQIENYFIELVKYIYADKVFTKIEVPSGTLPN